MHFYVYALIFVNNHRFARITELYVYDEINEENETKYFIVMSWTSFYLNIYSYVRTLRFYSVFGMYKSSSFHYHDPMPSCHSCSKNIEPLVYILSQHIDLLLSGLMGRWGAGNDMFITSILFDPHSRVSSHPIGIRSIRPIFIRAASGWWWMQLVGHEEELIPIV